MRIVTLATFFFLGCPKQIEPESQTLRVDYLLIDVLDDDEDFYDLPESGEEEDYLEEDTGI